VLPKQETQRDDACLRIAAERDGGGAVHSTWLWCSGNGQLAIGQEGPGAHGLCLPQRALQAVFDRYGKPLEADVKVTEEAPALHVPHSGPGEGTGLRVRLLRYRPLGWIDALDYLVLERPGCDALCAPAPLVAAALLRLAQVSAALSSGHQ
jgi:hypothetical protein